MSLTEQQITACTIEGFLSGIRILDEAEADHYRMQFDELEEREGREKCQIGLIDRHLDQEFIW